MQNFKKIIFILIVIIYIATEINISFASEIICNKNDIINISTDDYFCTNETTTNKYKNINVTITGNITELWNQYTYDNIINLSFEPENNIIIEINQEDQSLNIQCENASFIKEYPKKQYIYSKKTRHIICTINGFVVKNKYSDPFDLAIKHIYIIPITKISLSKGFFPEEIPKKQYMNTGRKQRGVKATFKNDKNYSVIYEFKIYRNNASTILENMIEVMNGKVIVKPKNSFTAHAFDYYLNKTIYWINVLPYYLYKINKTDLSKLSTITPNPTKKISSNSGSGGSSFYYNFSTNSSNTTNSSHTKKIDNNCLALFHRNVIINDFDKKDITINYEFLNPCNLNRTIKVVDPIPNNFIITNMPIGEIKNQKLYFKVILLPHFKKNINYSLKYLGKEHLVMLSQANIVENNKSFTLNNIPLNFGNFKEEAIFVKKTLKFLNSNDVKVSLNIQNIGTKTTFLIRDLAESYSQLSQPFIKRGIWKVNLLENEMWFMNYITKQSNKMYTIPQVIGFQGKVFYTLISTSKTSEEIKIKTYGIQYLPIIIIILSALSVIIIITATILKHTNNEPSWTEIDSKMKELKKLLK